MYYRELETVPGAKEEYNRKCKQLAAERLRAVAAKKKLKKQQKQ